MGSRSNGLDVPNTLLTCVPAVQPPICNPIRAVVPNPPPGTTRTTQSADKNQRIDPLEVEVAILQLYMIVNKRLPGWQVSTQCVSLPAATAPNHHTLDHPRPHARAPNTHSDPIHPGPPVPR